MELGFDTVLLEDVELVRSNRLSSVGPLLSGVLENSGLSRKFSYPESNHHKYVEKNSVHNTGYIKQIICLYVLDEDPFTTCY